jgi:MFS family permease
MSTTIDRGAPDSGKTDSGLRGSHAVRWWVLVVLGMAQLMVMLDATVVNIALPRAQQDLGFSDGSRQWVITGYALAFGSLLLLGGRLGDLLGRRTLFVIGVAGFGAASVLGGSASSFEILVAARVAQGLFAALLAPAALSLLSVTFTEPSERAKAFGVFSALGGAGGAIGLLLGGMLTEWASWRWAGSTTTPAHPRPASSSPPARLRPTCAPRHPALSQAAAGHPPTAANPTNPDQY